MKDRAPAVSPSPSPPPPAPRSIFDRIEQAPGSAWGHALLLGAWIFGRNLLEGILEASHIMGFDWRLDVSLPMMFLHFPLFYLALFLLLALWLHALTGASIGRISRVLCVGFGVLLVAPIIDALVSGGRGYDLNYLPGFGSILWRFWNPGQATAETSPGQRVEILLAVIGIALYAHHLAMARCSRGSRGGGAPWLMALASAAGAFVLMALLGAWPSLFARSFAPAAGSAGASAYAEVFRGRGLVPGESARHAIVIALPFAAALCAYAWRLDPARFRALAKRALGVRMLHYTGLVPVGALLGWVVYRDAFPGAFVNPIDAAAVLVLWISMAAAFLAAVCWNDLGDRQADAVNQPSRPLPVGAVSPPALETLAWLASALSAWLALAAGYACFLLVCACLLLAWLYSRPPARLKRWPGSATFTLALLSALSMATGFALFAQEMTPWVFPRRVLAALVVGITLGFAAKDIGDGEGDRASGVVTIATLWGDARARIVGAILVALAFLQAPLCLPLGVAALIAAIVLAAGAAWITLRAARPAVPLLALFLVFTLILLGLLARRPDLLQEKAPGWMPVSHAQIRAIEEEVRLERIDAQGGLRNAAAAEASQREARSHALSDALDHFVAAAQAAAPPPSAPAPSSPQAKARDGAAMAGRRAAWLERALWARAQSAQGSAGDASELASLRPGHAAYLEAGKNAAHRAGDDAAAEEFCHRALALHARPGDFLRERAALRVAAARSSEGENVARSAQLAAHDLAAAFLFRNEEARLWLVAGDLALARRDPAHAREAFERSITLDSTEASAFAGLAEAHYASGSLAGALRAMEQAYARSPEDPWILNNWGVMLREAGDLEQAARRFERAHRLAPRFFEPLFNLGLTCERLGRADEALRWYEQADPLRPGFPPLEEARARVARR